LIEILLTQTKGRPCFRRLPAASQAYLHINRHREVDVVLNDGLVNRHLVVSRERMLVFLNFLEGSIDR
jgi:hypothetical protein